MDIAEAYVSAVETLLVLVVPILLVSTLFAWHVAHRFWPYRLPAAIALTNTVTGACATWLVWTTLYRARVGPVPDEFLPVTATTVLVLCIAPAFSIAYLAYLQVQRDG